MQSTEAVLKHHVVTASAKKLRAIAVDLRSLGEHLAACRVEDQARQLEFLRLDIERASRSERRAP